MLMNKVLNNISETCKKNSEEVKTLIKRIFMVAVLEMGCRKKYWI